MKSSNTIKKGAEVKLYIESLAFGGRGIAHLNDQVVFVKDAIPGQIVLSRITKKRPNYLEACSLEVIDQSTNFVEPECNHFNDCGGCTFQNLHYKEQLNHKESQIRDLFARIGGFTDVSVSRIVECNNIYRYRNKMEFTFSNRRWILKENDSGLRKDFALGLHIPGRFDKILDIEHCHLQSNTANDLLDFIKSECIEKNLEPYDIKNHSGYLRHLMFRTGCNTDEIMVNFVTSIEKPKLLKPIADSLVKKFPNVTSVVNNINTRKADIAFGEWEILLSGRDYIVEKLGKYKFEISANSFFQTNTHQAENLYEIICKECALSGEEIVYDLYCGTGSISIFISEMVKAVYGIELIETAVANARKNADLNNVNNVYFFCGDLINILIKDSEVQSIPKPDVIIIDPPRAGMHKNTIKDILRLSPKKIVYCSCNPSTQARDVRIFCDNGYSLIKVRPVDMFPHTPHIENVVTLLKE